MGHGKNKQQQGGLGAVPKETKEQKRQRLADEAAAREQCMKALPYAIGCVVFLTIAFALWVHSLPPPPVRVAAPLQDSPIPRSGSGMTFEEALAAQTDPNRKENLQNLFANVNAEMKEEKLKAETGEEEEPENVMNLDGDEL